LKYALFILLAVSILGGCKSEEDSPAPGATENSAIKEAAKPQSPMDLVKTASKARWVSKNVKTFLPLWAEECQMTHGRKEKPSIQDPDPFDCNQMQSWAHIEFSKPKLPGATLTQEDILEETTDGVTIITVTNVISWSENQNKVRERFNIISKGDDLLIKKHRSWPISSKTGAEETAYNQKTWAQLDREIATLLVEEEVDSRKLIDALVSAYKIRDAYAEANQRIIDDKEMTVDDWLKFAEVSLRSGHTGTAAKTYERIKKMDPKKAVPKGALNWKEE